MEITVESQYEASCRALSIKPNSRIRKDIAHHLSATHLVLDSNFLGPLGLQAFMTVLEQCTKTESISLRNNGLDDDSVQVLCQVLVKNPTVVKVDLSENPIGLHAAYAIMDLIRKNTRITTVVLEKTDVEDSVLAKLRKLLDATKVAALKASSVVRPTPYEDAVANGQRKKSALAGKLTGAAAIRSVEKQIRNYVQERVTGGGKYQRTGPHDFLIIPLLVLSTKYDFQAELQILHNAVIPAINEKLHSRKAYVHPISMYYNPSSKSVIRDMRHPTPGNLQNHLHLLRTYRPLCVTFLGDTYGWVPLHGLNAPGLWTADTTPLRHTPTVHWEAALFHANPNCISMVMNRFAAPRIGAPIAVLECLSDDVARTHPDPEPSAVQVIHSITMDTTAHALTKQHELLVALWDGFTKLKQDLKENTPSFMITKDYSASYSHMDARGSVLLKDMDAMQEELQERLWVVLDEIIPPLETDSGSTSSDAPWYCVSLQETSRQVLMSKIPPVIGQKASLSKLDVYTATPASRNMYLLCAAKGYGSSSIIGNYLLRVAKRTPCVISYHLTSRSALSHDSRDLRTVLLSLCRQLLKESTLPSHIQAEIRITEIIRYFKETLHECSKALPEGKCIVLVVEDLDEIAPAVFPCKTLMEAETGVDSLQEVAVDESNSSDDPFVWLPVCLARNIRIIGTAALNSHAHFKLSTRGQDSCEVLVPQNIGDAEVDTVAAKFAANHNMELNESELGAIRSKEGSRLPQYVNVLIDLLAFRYEQPGTYERTETYVERLPVSLVGLCNTLIDLIESEIGGPLAKKALSLIAVATKNSGITELQLRSMLGDGATAPLCGELFVPLIRRLRAVTYPHLQPSGTALNGHNMILQYSCRTFCQAVLDRYCGTSNDLSAVHQYFVTYYKKLLDEPNHPLHALAVRQLPNHMIECGQWNTFLNTICKLTYVSLAFGLGVGYCLYRDIILCYNRLEASASNATTADRETALFQLKEYIIFVNRNFLNLTNHPTMCHQLALLVSAVNGSVYHEARDYYKSMTTKVPYFTFVNKGRVKLHKDIVNKVMFAPNGLSFATCSKDRTLRLCNVRGDTTTVISQLLCPILNLTFSSTNKYLLATCEERFVSSIDVTEGKIISRMTGHLGNIVCARVSIRGKYAVTGGDDRAMCVWDSETGRCLTLQPHNEYSSSNGTGVVKVVRCHPFEETVFLSVCDRTVVQWKLKPTGDGVTCMYSMASHPSLQCIDALFLKDGTYVLSVASGATTTTTTTNRMNASASTSVITPLQPEIDSPVKIWQNGQLAAYFEVPSDIKGSICSVAVAPNETTVVLGTTLGVGLVYTIPWKDLLQTKKIAPTHVLRGLHRMYGGDSKYPNSMMFVMTSHTSALFSTIGSDKMLNVVSASTGKVVAQYVSEYPIVTADWSPIPTPEGGDIILGDNTGRVYVLKLNNVMSDNVSQQVE
eukprot:PhF_6_TR10572/c0_g1_i1/m.16846